MFDSTNITKHGLTYTTLFRICFTKQLYMLSLLSNTNFQIDPIVQEEMYRLKTNIYYQLIL
jgi:hypothetical protein